MFKSVFSKYLPISLCDIIHHELHTFMVSVRGRKLAKSFCTDSKNFRSEPIVVDFINNWPQIRIS